MKRESMERVSKIKLVSAVVSCMSASLVVSGGSSRAATQTEQKKPATLNSQFLDVGPYMVHLSIKVKDHWHAPKGTPKTVVVEWTVLPDGGISSLHVERSSGDTDSDKAAIEAVAGSVPFEPLPKGVTSAPVEFTFNENPKPGLHSVSLGDRAASQSLANEAIELINKKQLGDAIDKLEFALDRDPGNAQVPSCLQYIAAYISDASPENLRYLHRVLALDPRQAGASERLFLLLKASGKDPGSASQRLAIGDEALLKKDGETAVVEFTAANKLRPDTCPSAKLVEAYRIIAAHRLGKQWQTYLSMRRDVEALCGMGRSHQLAGEYDDAEKNFQEALSLDPSSQMAKDLLSKLHEERAGGLAAEPVSPPVMVQSSKNIGAADLIPRAQVLSNEAVKEMGSGDYDTAISTLKEALAADPSDKTARSNLSTAYNNLVVRGGSSSALHDLRRALYLVPDSPLVRKNLNNTLRSAGKNPEAFEERAQMAGECAADNDYVGATVEAREALLLRKDDAMNAKLKQFLEKAPQVP